MSRWAEFGFPDKLKQTPWKKVCEGLILAFEQKFLATGTMVQPLRCQPYIYRTPEDRTRVYDKCLQGENHNLEPRFSCRQRIYESI